jgi:hypothetical protein
VALADHTSMAIEEVRPGMCILQKGANTQEFATAKVTRAHSSICYTLGHIRTKTGRHISCTTGHPFYLPDQGTWSSIDGSCGHQLCPKDRLLTADAEPDWVESITIEKLAMPERVFNLSVSGESCYFAEGVLVHNDCEQVARLKKLIHGQIISMAGGCIGLLVGYASEKIARGCTDNIAVVHVTSHGAACMSGAATGAALGTFIFPGIGTAAGAIIGAIGGTMCNAERLYFSVVKDKRGRAKLDHNKNPIYLGYLSQGDKWAPHPYFAGCNYALMSAEVSRKGNIDNFKQFMKTEEGMRTAGSVMELYWIVKETADFVRSRSTTHSAVSATANLTMAAIGTVAIVAATGGFAAPIIAFEAASVLIAPALLADMCNSLVQLGWDASDADYVQQLIEKLQQRLGLWDRVLSAAMDELLELKDEGVNVDMQDDLLPSALIKVAAAQTYAQLGLPTDYMSEMPLAGLSQVGVNATLSGLQNLGRQGVEKLAEFSASSAGMALLSAVGVGVGLVKGINSAGRFGKGSSEAADCLDERCDQLCGLLFQMASVTPASSPLTNDFLKLPKMLQINVGKCLFPSPDWRLGDWDTSDAENAYIHFKLQNEHGCWREVTTKHVPMSITCGSMVEVNKAAFVRFLTESEVSVSAYDMRSVQSKVRGDPALGTGLVIPKSQMTPKDSGRIIRRQTEDSTWSFQCRVMPLKFLDEEDDEEGEDDEEEEEEEEGEDDEEEDEELEEVEWEMVQGLPKNEGKDVRIDKSGVATLEDIKAACEANEDCVGFAYLPANGSWFPKKKGTGFDPSTATYSQKHGAKQVWQWHFMHERTAMQWVMEHGLPKNEGNDIRIDKSGVATLEDIKAACEANEDCVGFAYLPTNRSWFPKKKGTGFDPNNATYSQKHGAKQMWQWHFMPKRSETAARGGGYHQS